LGKWVSRADDQKNVKFTRKYLLIPLQTSKVHRTNYQAYIIENVLEPVGMELLEYQANIISLRYIVEACKKKN